MKFGIYLLPVVIAMMAFNSSAFAQEETEKLSEKKVKIVTVQPDGTKEVEEFEINGDEEIEKIIESHIGNSSDEDENTDIEVIVKKGNDCQHGHKKMIREKVVIEGSSVKKVGMGLIFDSRYTTNFVVKKVLENSPAAESGVQTGDVLTAVDGKDIRRFEDLQEALEGKKAGKKVDLEFIRYGMPMKVALTLREIELPTGQVKEIIKKKSMDTSMNNSTGIWLGLRVHETTKGLVVDEVLPQGIAGEIGIETNDVLSQINNQELKNLQDVNAVLTQLAEGDTLDIQVMKRGCKPVQLKAKV